MPTTTEQIAAVMKQLETLEAKDMPESIREGGKTLREYYAKSVMMESDVQHKLNEMMTSGNKTKMMDGVLSMLQKTQDDHSELVFLSGKAIIAWKRIVKEYKEATGT